jgi:hypothetical protein
VQPLSEKDIRGSFVNCSKGEAQRMNVPRDLAGLDWATRDFLGWCDPGAPERAYLIAERTGAGAGRTALLAVISEPGRAGPGRAAAEVPGPGRGPGQAKTMVWGPSRMACGP